MEVKMGWWKSENGIIGDSVADVIDSALNKIESIYLKECGRSPLQGELANLIEFSTCGCLKPFCGNAKYPFSKSTVGDDNTPRIGIKGEQGAMGIGCSSVKEDEMVNVNPATGKHYKSSEMNKVIEEQRRELGRNKSK
jgi:hypothetical protein